jgi:hypothetical protein
MTACSHQSHHQSHLSYYVELSQQNIVNQNVEFNVTHVTKCNITSVSTFLDALSYSDSQCRSPIQETEFSLSYCYVFSD